MKATIYIRPDNEERWAEIDRKSEWVNDMLSGEEPSFDRKVRRVVEQVLQEKASRGY